MCVCVCVAIVAAVAVKRVQANNTRFRISRILLRVVFAYASFPTLLFSADAPEIKVDKSWIHADVGVELKLSCIVYAEPKAEVSRRNVINN